MALDLQANALVDKFAKDAARTDRISKQQRKVVSDLSDKDAAIAGWLGQVTHLANNLPDLAWDGSSQRKMLRDSEGMRSRAVSQSQLRKSRQPADMESSARKEQTTGVQLHDLSSHPW